MVVEIIAVINMSMQDTIVYEDIAMLTVHDIRGYIKHDNIRDEETRHEKKLQQLYNIDVRNSLSTKRKRKQSQRIKP